MYKYITLIGVCLCLGGCLPDISKVKSEIMDTMNARFDACEAKVDALAEQLAWCQTGAEPVPGPQGPVGESGLNGADGQDGLDGIDGTNGLDGEPCSVYCIDRQTAVVVCPDGSMVTIRGRCWEGGS